MENTWDTSDFRVLEAIVEITDGDGTNSVTAERIAFHTGLDDTTVQAALRALSSEDPPFFEAQGSWGGGILRAFSPTGHARRAVGAWPTAENLANQLIAKIESAAAGESDEGKRSTLNQLAGFFATGRRDLLVDIAAEAITGAYSCMCCASGNVVGVPHGPPPRMLTHSQFHCTSATEVQPSLRKCSQN